MPHARAPPPGIYPPLVNFFHEDSSLDLESIKQHAVRTAKAGVTGLVIMGSNGEAMHLERDERFSIVSTIRKALDQEGLTSFPLIIGCGQQSKRSTLLTIQDAKDAGGNFALVLPPSYWPVAMNKPNVTKYFKELADESALPILIYNFPLVANGVTVDSDQMIELAKHDNIVGCKLTCGNMGNLHRTALHTKPEEFAVLAGKGEFTLHGLMGGAAGAIAALVNIAPKAHVALYKAYHDEDYKRARKIQDILADGDLAQQKLGVAGLKLIVSQWYGYGSGLARSPLPSGNLETMRAQDGPLTALLELEKSL